MSFLEDRIIELTEEETTNFVSLYNQFLSQEEGLYVFQYFNCSECVEDGGGDILFLRKNNISLYYYENENCFETIEKTLFSTTKHYLITEIKQTFDETWKKYYPKGIKCD